MNKKVFVLLFLGMIVFLSAQNQRFMYEYKFVSDSTNRDDVKTELMNLDTTPKGSKFYSYTSYKSDSLMRVDLEKQLKANGSINIKTDQRKGVIRYAIAKNYTNGNIDFRTRIGMDAFRVAEERKMTWKILPDKQKIGNWETQKATTEYGGRKWTAWFTEAIPFPDGPYKFSGLPGLIVKIEDADKNYSWVLTANKKLKEFEEYSYSEKLQAQFGGKNDINVISRDKFESSFETYKKDPLASIRGQIPQDRMNMKMPGSDKTVGEMLKDQEKMLKDFYSASDNTIELPQPKNKK